jgi:hypothetical protein
MKPIFVINVSTKKDILLAQLRTRQLCRMLGFSALEQARLVGLVFEVVSGPVQRHRSAALTIQVADHALEVLWAVKPQADRESVTPAKPAQLALSVALPPAALATEDIFWAMHQIQCLTKPDLLGEMRQQNTDLLRLLSERAGASSPAAPRGPRLRVA